MENRSQENAVLSTCMVFQKRFETLVKLGNIFSEPRNKELYEIMRKSFDLTGEVSKSAVMDYILNNRLNYSTNELCDDIITDAYFDRDVSEIITKNRKKRILNILKSAKDKDYDEIIAEINNELFTESYVLNEPKLLKEILPECAEKHDKVDVGIKWLMKKDGGMRRGEVLYIPARPNTGKTTKAVNILCAIDNILMFSMEENRVTLVRKMMSRLAGVDFFKIENGFCNNIELAKMEAAIDEIAKKNCYIDDTPNNTIENIVSKTNYMARKRRIDVVIMDHLHVTKTEKDFKHNDIKELAYITSEAKGLARRLKIPLIYFCQMNRKIEGRSDDTPLMSDIRGSGSVEENSDIVIFLQDKDGRIKNTVAKNRNGTKGVFWEEFYKNICRMDEITTGGNYEV